MYLCELCKNLYDNMQDDNIPCETCINSSNYINDTDYQLKEDK